MSRLAMLRPLLLIGLSIWLGSLVLSSPGLERITLDEPGITVALPKNLEGWRLDQGEGDLLLRGHSRLQIMELEIEKVIIRPGETLTDWIERRHRELLRGKLEFAVTFRSEDGRFGNHKVEAYRARYRDRILSLPLRGVVWQHDVYWPYQGGFLRVGMRYPDIASNYVEPTKYMLAASLRQSTHQEAGK